MYRQFCMHDYIVVHKVGIITFLQRNSSQISFFYTFYHVIASSL